jgi:hypothetical protein
MNSTTTLPAIFSVEATWTLAGTDQRNTTKMIMEPGQDILTDAPKIISVLLWSTNQHANLVKIIALRVVDALG